MYHDEEYTDNETMLSFSDIFIEGYQLQTVADGLQQIKLVADTTGTSGGFISLVDYDQSIADMFQVAKGGMLTVKVFQEGFVDVVKQTISAVIAYIVKLITTWINNLKLFFTRSQKIEKDLKPLILKLQGMSKAHEISLAQALGPASFVTAKDFVQVVGIIRAITNRILSSHIFKDIATHIAAIKSSTPPGDAPNLMDTQYGGSNLINKLSEISIVIGTDPDNQQFFVDPPGSIFSTKAVTNDTFGNLGYDKNAFTAINNDVRLTQVDIGKLDTVVNDLKHIKTTLEKMNPEGDANVGDIIKATINSISGSIRLCMVILSVNDLIMSQYRVLITKAYKVITDGEEKGSSSL